MSRLTVGIVSNLYPTKDHFNEGTFVKDLTDALAKSGCDVRIIHYRRNFVAMYLEVLARRKQVEILDAQFVAPSGVLASLTPKFCPFVVTVHRWDITDFPYRWPTSGQWTKFVLHRADGVVAVSAYIAKQTAKFADNPQKIRIIPNAVDITRFSPSADSGNIRAQLGVSENSFLILSVGRLHPIKGFEYLLVALREVIRRNLDVMLAIVGEGFYRTYLEYLAQTLHIRDRVRILGRVDERFLVELYSACDAFALTSLEEGHSVAITEAMACGKPILCSDIPNNREVVVHNFNGILVSPKNAGAIASAIEVLYTSDTLREEFGANSRNRAIEKFSWDLRTRNLLDFYQSLLSV